MNVPKDADIEVHLSRDAVRAPLVIAFGGMSASITIPVYEFHRFLTTHFHCHFMFIRDRSQCWYFRGIHGLGNNIDESVARLKPILQAIPTTRIITVGTSMGGYGALVFGLLLGVDEILAFNPQTCLDPVNREAIQDYKWKLLVESLYKMDTDHTQRYFDVLAMDPSAVGRVQILYGIHDGSDRKHARRMSAWLHPHVDVIPIEGGHLMMKILRDDGRLKAILQGALFPAVPTPELLR